MDLVSITGAYQGLKSAKDLLTVAFDAKVDAEAKTKIMEAQAKLGDVQDTLFGLREQLFNLQEERNQLRAQLASAASWSKKLDEYEMTKTAGGAVVLQSKAEPKHYVCPSCINKQELHPLQDNRTLSGKHRCTGCGAEFPIDPRQEQRWDPLPTGSPWSGA